MVAPYVPYVGPAVTRAEAKAAGLTRYFVGKPCPKGHISQKSTVNGTCLTCTMISSRAAAAKKPELRAAVKKRWRKANLAKSQADARALKSRKKEHYRLWTQAWLKKHAARLRDKRADQSKANVARVRRWRLANPEAASVLHRNGRMRRRGAEGRHTAAEVLALFDKQRGKCGYCRVSIRDGYHADHIQPIARGGSNWITNIQLLCPKCNTRKNVSDPIEFAQRMGLLI